MRTARQHDTSRVISVLPDGALAASVLRIRDSLDVTLVYTSYVVW